jgi:hypothetical protein
MEELWQLKGTVQSLQRQICNIIDTIDNQKVTTLRNNFVAGETISGGCAVWVDINKQIYLFDITNPYHYDKYVGIAETGTNTGCICSVVTDGVSAIMSSGWTAGKLYYIGSNSYLSENIPTSGLLKAVGVGIDNNTILINNSLDVIII